MTTKDLKDDTVRLAANNPSQPLAVIDAAMPTRSVGIWGSTIATDQLDRQDFLKRRLPSNLDSAVPRLSTHL
jgi:hypothetical protein